MPTSSIIDNRDANTLLHELTKMSAGGKDVLRFYDCGSAYHRPNIFSKLSSRDIEQLHIVDVKRRIPFIPVVTDPRMPISTAFIGLNAYCGDDFVDAVNQPNFAEWCQERCESKIFSVLGLYANAFKEKRIPPSSFYFTNYFKAVLPEGLFKGESAVVSLLKSNKPLTNELDLILNLEMKDLIAAGCKAFVCFGNSVAANNDRVADRYFGGTVSTDVKGVHHLRASPDEILVLREKHYSYYSKERTALLASALANHFDLLSKQ